eukprot:2014053-Lingulodinium_polyedra.AAC.1
MAAAAAGLATAGVIVGNCSLGLTVAATTEYQATPWADEIKAADLPRFAGDPEDLATAAAQPSMRLAAFQTACDAN